jgi:hypothetical protein
MILFLGDRTDAIDEVERLREVAKFYRFDEVVIVDHFPPDHLTQQRVRLFGSQGRDTTMTRNARLLR